MQQRCKLVCSCPMAASPWLWVSPATAHVHYIPHDSNSTAAAKPTVVAAAIAAAVAADVWRQHLCTATYKRLKIFVRRAVAAHTWRVELWGCGVLQRKMLTPQTPPPGHSGPRLLGGAGRSSHGGSTEIASSLRRAIRFPPGAHCASRSPEMGQEKTQTSLTIAPQSSEQTEKPS